MFGIDTRTGSGSQQHLAVGILAHRAEEGNLTAQPGRRNSLVGALAARIDRKTIAVQRFAGVGQPVGVDGQIGIEGAGNNNFGTHGATSASIGLGTNSEAARAAPVRAKATITTVK